MGPTHVAQRGPVGVRWCRAAPTLLLAEHPLETSGPAKGFGRPTQPSNTQFVATLTTSIGTGRSMQAAMFGRNLTYQNATSARLLPKRKTSVLMQVGDSALKMKCLVTALWDQVASSTLSISGRPRGTRFKPLPQKLPSRNRRG